ARPRAAGGRAGAGPDGARVRLLRARAAGHRLRHAQVAGGRRAERRDARRDRNSADAAVIAREVPAGRALPRRLSVSRSRGPLRSSPFWPACSTRLHPDRKVRGRPRPAIYTLEQDREGLRIIFARAKIAVEPPARATPRSASPRPLVYGIVMLDAEAHAYIFDPALRQVRRYRVGDAVGESVI